MRVLEGLLALLVLAGAVTLIVVLWRDMVRDRRDDSAFEPPRRRRRLVLTTMLFTLLFPSIGTEAGLKGFWVGLGLAGLLWVNTVRMLRRLRD
jgi:hypothetical protein